MKALVFGWLIITIATRSACSERALDYRGDDGMVVITPDWSSFASPSSACYRFYRADDGKKVNYGTDMFASAEYFSVVLPVGDYHLLAYNTNTNDVTFTGLEERRLAEVCLIPGMQPGNIYSWHVDNVDIPLQGTVRYTPVPRRLVKQMWLHFQVTGMEEATILNGKLNGVYPSVFLLSGAPSEQSISAAPVTNAEFTVALTRGKTRETELVYMASAEIRLLGLLSPEYGISYDSRLYLQVHNSSGKTYDTSVNMNRILTDIINLYAGELPVDETIEVNINVNLLDMVLSAVVESWTEGSGEGYIGTHK